jgi:hypothetical protein
MRILAELPELLGTVKGHDRFPGAGRAHDQDRPVGRCIAVNATLLSVEIT